MPARAPARGGRRTAQPRAGPPPTAAPPAHVLVCGAGIVGASTAYFLARRGVPKITLVDATGPAAAASGRAGGFLARDWCGGGAWGALAAAGFDLHAELAGALGEERVGYRRVATYAASFPAPGERAGGGGPPPSVPWLSPTATGVRKLGGHSTTAQVHPRRLVDALLDATGGALELVVDRVTGLAGADGDGRPGAVLERRGAVHADAVVVSLGPGRAEISRGAGRAPGEPECYPRPDGTVYVCGAGDGAPLPSSASDVSHDAAAISTLAADAAAIAPCLAGHASVTPSACYLPVTPTGLPFIGELPGRRGVYAAAGHGCWGILTGPATGRGVAGLVVGGAGDADAALVRPFGR